MVRRRYDERGLILRSRGAIAAVLIRRSRATDARRGGSPCVTARLVSSEKTTFGPRSRWTGNAAPLDDSANDIAPFDIERPASGQAACRSDRRTRQAGFVPLTWARRARRQLPTAGQNGESREQHLEVHAARPLLVYGAAGWVDRCRDALEGVVRQMHGYAFGVVNTGRVRGTVDKDVVRQR